MSSSILVIVVIAVLLVVLVSYAMISQTIARAREKRNRLLIALRSKSRNLKALLSGFPEGYLPRDISILLLKNLLDVLEQLSRLEPKESAHKEDLHWVSSLLADAQRAAKPETPQSLNNPQQIKEVKTCLEELHRFVAKQEKTGVFSKSTAASYRNQIKQLVLELTMDTYIIHGSNAEQVGKSKLAVLQFEHAINLALKEGSNSRQVTKKITFLRHKLSLLQEQIAQEESQTQPPQDTVAEEDESGDAWQKFEQEESDGWKKKHAYD